MAANNVRRGFTLIEILLVVLILGVLVVLVAPVVAGAGVDARKANLAEQLRVVRGQIQMFMLQHGDAVPALAGNNWDDLLQQTSYRGQPCGPYLPEIPRNALNNNISVFVVTTDATFGDPVTDPSAGFVFNSSNGRIWATNTLANRIYDESDPRNPNN